jgi:hypothetical protein
LAIVASLFAFLTGKKLKNGEPSDRALEAGKFSFRWGFEKTNNQCERILKMFDQDSDFSQFCEGAGEFLEKFNQVSLHPVEPENYPAMVVGYLLAKIHKALSQKETE